MLFVHSREGRVSSHCDDPSTKRRKEMRSCGNKAEFHSEVPKELRIFRSSASLFTHSSHTHILYIFRVPFGRTFPIVGRTLDRQDHFITPFHSRFSQQAFFPLSNGRYLGIFGLGNANHLRLHRTAFIRRTLTHLQPNSNCRYLYG